MRAPAMRTPSPARSRPNRRAGHACQQLLHRPALPAARVHDQTLGLSKGLGDHLQRRANSPPQELGGGLGITPGRTRPRGRPQNQVRRAPVG